MSLLGIAFNCFAYQPPGSEWVPLDSWVYPAFDRLVALGLVQGEFLGLRPWTRMRCAELVHEAAQRLTPEDTRTQSYTFYRQLEKEFAPELARLAGDSNGSADVDSMYFRTTQISGQPLNDSYHFGQTIANDFGRPYGEGNSDILGGEAHFDYKRFFAAGRAEYQHAPDVPAYSPELQAALTKLDHVHGPSPNTTGRGEVNDFRMLDTYVGFRFDDWQMSFGKQSLYWSPVADGALLYSNNVDPLYMLRLSQVEPAPFPTFLRFLGVSRSEFFFAKMSGHLYPARPFIHGEKVSLKPTPNLEIGFSRTTVFLGEGHGMTVGRILKSYFSVGDNLTSNQSSSDPGDRKGGLDVRYRFPGIRDWLTIYTDSFTDDDPSPLAAPHRAPFNPGIYLPKLPKFHNLDFRAEVAYTDLVAEHSKGGTFVYYNSVYHDSYLQKGYLLGNVVGRQGKATQVQSTYWFDARNNVKVIYRGARVNPDFTGGGTQNTFRVENQFYRASSGLSVNSAVQWERWWFPDLAPGPQHDVSGWIQLKYEPHWRVQFPTHDRSRDGSRVLTGSKQFSD